MSFEAKNFQASLHVPKCEIGWFFYSPPITTGGNEAISIWTEGCAEHASGDALQIENYPAHFHIPHLDLTYIRFSVLRAAINSTGGNKPFPVRTEVHTPNAMPRWQLVDAVCCLEGPRSSRCPGKQRNHGPH